MESQPEDFMLESPLSPASKTGTGLLAPLRTPFPVPVPSLDYGGQCVHKEI